MFIINKIRNINNFFFNKDTKKLIIEQKLLFTIT